MCVDSWKSAFELLEAVTFIELFLPTLHDNGLVNQCWSIHNTQKRRGPTSRCKMPLVLMHDRCEDG